MFPASTKGGGQAMASAPDVCKTPAAPSPIPVPYPNMAQVMQAAKTSTKVKIVAKEACSVKTEVPRTMGDEAGTLGGVVSGMNMDKMTYKKGSAKVLVEGQGITHLTSMTGHNGMSANAPAGTQVAPSQTKVIVAP
jgi:hypothetical protein